MRSGDSHSGENGDANGRDFVAAGDFDAGGD
jgi:hypothetical protein